jgi:hypothetical protein
VQTSEVVITLTPFNVGYRYFVWWKMFESYAASIEFPFQKNWKQQHGKWVILI